MSKIFAGDLTALTEINGFPLTPGDRDDARRIYEALREALRLVGVARHYAQAHAARWPVMPGELEAAERLLAVNCGTVRTAAELNQGAIR